MNKMQKKKHATDSFCSICLILMYLQIQCAPNFYGFKVEKIIVMFHFVNARYAQAYGCCSGVSKPCRLVRHTRVSQAAKHILRKLPSTLFGSLHFLPVLSSSCPVLADDFGFSRLVLGLPPIALLLRPCHSALGL